MPWHAAQPVAALVPAVLDVFLYTVAPYGLMSTAVLSTQSIGMQEHELAKSS